MACWWVAALNNTQPCGFVREAFAWPPVPLAMMGAWCACVVLGRVVLLVLWCRVWLVLCVGVRLSLCEHCDSACTRGYKSYWQLF